MGNTYIRLYLHNQTVQFGLIQERMKKIIVKCIYLSVETKYKV